MKVPDTQDYGTVTCSLLFCCERQQHAFGAVNAEAIDRVKDPHATYTLIRQSLRSDSDSARFTIEDL
jgi:hypothetical protein